MTDLSPITGSQEVALKVEQKRVSDDHPLQLEQPSQSANPYESDQDSLDAEYDEPEKPATDIEPAGSGIDVDKSPSKGSICEVKEIYDVKSSKCSCCTEWVDDKPGRKAAEPKVDRRTRFSIIRRMKPHAGGWNTHSIIVNSSTIQKSMGKIFEGYPVTYVHDHELILSAPFTPFCHRWDRLLEAERDEPCETKDHLTLLRSTLEIDVAHNLERRKIVISKGLASFSDLELVFEPGQIVIHKEANGTWSAGILRRNWKLEHFDGTKTVHSLDIAPLYLHPDREKVSRELVERGKKFEKLHGRHFLAYAGDCACGGKEFEHKARYIRGRVIIDQEGYWTLAEKHSLPSLEPFDKTTRTSSDHGTETISDTDQLSNSLAENVHPAPLTDDQLLLAPHCVRGLALEDKDWHDFAVDYIAEIEWIPDLMSRLVLAQDTKDLIVALLDNNSVGKPFFDDFVPGKGRGIILLLCGPPGVGKTLTAEVVSEHLKSPLYRISLQDLGSDVSKLEGKLQTALKRCSRWNAVLLIDEADIFLEQRSIDSLGRNELVSIFLQALEYYEGAMILTTNRATTLDPAFESRIDLTLTFEALTKEARREIWDGIMRENKTQAQLSDEDMDRISEWELNGRQIKSAVKTASIFAASQNGPMTRKHLDVVIGLRNSARALVGSGKT